MASNTTIIQLFITIVLLAFFWWLLSNGATTSWVVGLPALAAATWAHRYLYHNSSKQISVIGFIRFIPFFLWESLRGGTDVARRTLMPHMPVKPGFHQYRTKLKTTSARTFFANCVSLLPGTLTADLQEEWLEIHLLTTESDPNAALSRLESVVARVFSNIGDA